jgi:hypothetical protein
MKPPVVPHNRAPQVRNEVTGGGQMHMFFSTYPARAEQAEQEVWL